MAMAVLAELANVAWLWASGPSGSDRGSKGPRYKSSCAVFLILENCCKCLKVVKCIEYTLFVRKICMTYQNVQKIKFYMFNSH
jgi:hypothetical protein